MNIFDEFERKLIQGSNKIEWNEDTKLMFYIYSILGNNYKTMKINKSSIYFTNFIQVTNLVWNGRKIGLSYLFFLK